MIKKVLAAALVIFCMMGAPLSLAEDSVSIDFCYSDMEDCFQEAMAPETLEGRRKEAFEEIISLYEGSTGVQNHQYAAYYYNYAKGYLAFSREDWAGAKRYFDLCRVNNFGEETAYYCFAMGMLYAENEDYARAISMFNAAAGEGGSLNSRATTQSGICRRLYEEQLMKNSREALEAGDYDSAQQYFDLLKTEFPESVLSTETLRLEESTDTEAVFSWTTECASVRLLMSTDLVNKPENSGEEERCADTRIVDLASGEQGRVVVGDLLPASPYAVYLQDAETEEILYAMVFSTGEAAGHSAYHVDKYRLNLYPKDSYEEMSKVLKAGATVWPVLANTEKLMAVPDNCIRTDRMEKDGYVLFLRVLDGQGNPLPLEQIQWETLCLLLRIDGVTTIARSEAVGQRSEQADSILEAYDSRTIALRWNDMLNQAQQDGAIGSSGTYTLTLLMDGMQLFRMQGELGEAENG